MLKLATLIHNPAEPPAESQYEDPQTLSELGYNACVFYETTAISGVAGADVVVSSEMRRWVQNTIDQVSRKIERARQAGLQVFLFYDLLVLPRDLVDRNRNALTCRKRPSTLCPASAQALKLSVAAADAMLQRWPDVAGLVLRFGDTDAARLPHLMGNDIYAPHCPRCSDQDRDDRIINAITPFYDLVVKKSQKKLIVRAWNVRPHGLHDTPELAQRVLQRLPGKTDEPQLVMSFKFTQTDFWRYQDWNRSSLTLQSRPVIYELQCQREFEGKGGIPNWQVPLWRDGYPETREHTPPAGLAHLGERVNLVGLWAWVRGGGWGGPFVKNETWIDANVFAVPRLAQHLDADPQTLAGEWIAKRLGVSDEHLTTALLRVLEHSPEIIRQALYIGPFAQRKDNPWHPNADWIQDDLIDADAAWRMIQSLPEADLEAVVNEKRIAAEHLSDDRAALQKVVGDRRHHQLEPLVNTLIYAESLVETLRDLVGGLVAYRRYLKQKQPGTAEVARQKLYEAQTHWNHHTQRHGSLPGCATAFRETGFWELTQQILTDLA